MAKIEKIGNTQVIDNKEDNFFYFPMISMACTGVCYIGGLANDGKTPMDTRTEAQREALQGLLRELHQRFPKALIVGHQDLDPSKSCPCFNVVNEFSD